MSEQPATALVAPEDDGEGFHREVMLFTGQWADLPLEEVCVLASRFGYDGLELACWGDHFEVDKALSDDTYCQRKRDLLEKHNLKCRAISNHLVGQATLDIIPPPGNPKCARYQAILPPYVYGDGKPDGVNERAVGEMKNTAIAASKFGVTTVNGFTGSPIWDCIYGFPPTPQSVIDWGFGLLAERWNPICDVFDANGVRFALEVHPTEIGFDLYSAEMALKALDRRKAFGFNFDPSHLIWQGVDPVEFIRYFPDRIYHVHMKDAETTLDGRSGILSSHLDFGDPRRGWDFRSVGRGAVRFDQIIRALNAIGYTGPLSVEWEDKGMMRNKGARESCQYCRKVDFAPSDIKFDAAFSKP
ncbi:MAG: xylose isomerase domain-containing protein TIM barrel [Candidatus Peregrinibacteria bacterium Greene0416_62]|nr:MAG: xylose isomerase domain-containing protein TIM barrel [Candidatus Peregrinibacteria bacterium Greene0416_62]